MSRDGTTAATGPAGTDPATGAVTGVSTASVPAQGADRALARTGSSVVEKLALALLLLVAGSMLIVAAGRWRRAARSPQG